MKAAKSVPTKRFDRKGTPNEMNSKVVKSILKKGEAAGKSSKGGLAEKLKREKKERSVTFKVNGEGQDKRKLEKKTPTEADLEKSLKIAAMEKMNEKGGKANKKQQLVKGTGAKSHEKEKEKGKEQVTKTKQVAKADVAKGKKSIDYGKKNSRPVNYFPCKKRHVEAMFKTPSPKNRGSGSSVGSSIPSKVKDMQSMLEPSDCEGEKSENEMEEDPKSGSDEEPIQESGDEEESNDEEEQQDSNDEENPDDSEAGQEEEEEDEEEESESEDCDSEDQKENTEEVPEGNWEPLALVTQSTEKNASNLRNSCLAGVGILWMVLFIYSLFFLKLRFPNLDTISLFPNLRRNKQEGVGQLCSLKGKVQGS